MEALQEAYTYQPKPYYKSPDVIDDLQQEGPEPAQQLEEITELERTILALETKNLEPKQ